MDALVLKNGTMSSVEIAELTGMRHSDVMRAIRNMEPSWEKVCGRNFSLTFKTKELPNGGVRKDPIYQLNKTECLYIATKFNDEARAKLVLRWEELETEKLKTPTLSSAEIILQIAQFNVAQERRLSTVEQNLNTVIEEKKQSEFDLDYLPVSDDPMPGMNLRKKILAIVNTYQRSTQMAHRTLWDSIYKKLYYNYGVAIQRCKKINKSETWLEVAERKGHLEKIYSIVSELVKAKQ